MEILSCRLRSEHSSNSNVKPINILLVENDPLDSSIEDHDFVDLSTYIQVFI